MLLNQVLKKTKLEAESKETASHSVAAGTLCQMERTRIDGEACSPISAKNTERG